MPARTTLSHFFFLFSVAIAVVSCQEAQLEAGGETYLDLPAERYQYNNFTDTSNAISTLGRVLFYDRNLSLNNTIACASCHKQTAGFADDQKLSRGFEGRLTSRNSMPIQNLFNFNFMAMDLVGSPNSFFGQQHLFWDGREQVLEKLVLQPIGNHIEMGVADAETLSNKLSVLPYYGSLFNDAYGSPEVTTQGIATAISTFVTGIVTTNTRFDRFNRTRFMFQPDEEGKSEVPPQTIMNSLEIEGMLLFQEKYDCNTCHGVESPSGYIFVGGTFANIGLDADYSDPGLQNVTGNPADAGKFKIPSLRNVAYTAPYMHDGRFATLDEVLEHYSEGIADHPNLDIKLQDNTGHARSMSISDHEKKAIIAFIHTLSDESVLTDPRFSNPFKVK